MFSSFFFTLVPGLMVRPRVLGSCRNARAQLSLSIHCKFGGWSRCNDYRMKSIEPARPISVAQLSGNNNKVESVMMGAWPWIGTLMYCGAFNHRPRPLLLVKHGNDFCHVQHACFLFCIGM